MALCNLGIERFSFISRKGNDFDLFSKKRKMLVFAIIVNLSLCYHDGWHFFLPCRPRVIPYPSAIPP
jgi:hypothetical protein